MNLAHVFKDSFDLRKLDGLGVIVDREAVDPKFVFIGLHDPHYTSAAVTEVLKYCGSKSKSSAFHLHPGIKDADGVFPAWEDKLFRFYVCRELGQTTVYLNFKERNRYLSKRVPLLGRTLPDVRRWGKPFNSHPVSISSPSKPMAVDRASIEGEGEALSIAQEEEYDNKLRRPQRPPCHATRSKRFYARALGVRSHSTTPCLERGRSVRPGKTGSARSPGTASPGQGLYEPRTSRPYSANRGAGQRSLPAAG